MEPTLRDYLTILAKRKWLISLPLGVCLLAAAAATLLMTPAYEAATQLFVGQRQVAQTNILQGQEVNQTSASLLKSYARIATTRPIAEQAVQRHHLTVDPARLARELVADPLLDTQILRLSWRSSDPALAQATVNAVAQAFVDEIQKVEVPVQGDKTPAIKVSVVESAALPTKPVSPDPTKNFGLALLLGLLVGCGLALLAENLNTTIKSRRDIHNTNLQVLAEIPKASSNGITVDNEGGPVAEAFRRLRAGIRFIDVNESVRSMLVTSALPAEGKSTVALNLAIVYAQARMPTLLLEADLRNPVLHKIFNFEGAPGIADVLSEGLPLQRALLRTQLDNLTIMPAGMLPHDPSELVGSQEMVDVINELRTLYGIVIIDSAPLLPVADSLALAPRVDGTIIVVRGRRTKRGQLEEALEAIHHVGGKTLGLVLNAVRPEPGGGYKYGGYYQYVKR